MSQPLAYLIYAVFALGAAGIYFALPRPHRSTVPAGHILGVAAVALFVVLVASYALPSDGAGFSYVFSAMALLAAGRVVTHAKPVYCVLYFVLVVLSVAMLLVLQQAEFLAIALVIIYAGAILVTYAFVLMLAQQSATAPFETRSREPGLAVLAGFVVMAAVAGQVADLPVGAKASSGPEIRLAQAHVDDERPVESSLPAIPVEGNTVAMGRLLLTNYVITLEVAGVLLLVALIGAIAIARKRVPAEELGGHDKPLGQVGREAPPF